MGPTTYNAGAYNGLRFWEFKCERYLLKVLYIAVTKSIKVISDYTLRAKFRLKIINNAICNLSDVIVTVMQFTDVS